MCYKKWLATQTMWPSSRQRVLPSELSDKQRTSGSRPRLRRQKRSALEARR